MPAKRAPPPLGGKSFGNLRFKYALRINSGKFRQNPRNRQIFDVIAEERAHLMDEAHAKISRSDAAPLGTGASSIRVDIVREANEWQN
jgi:hypothetical protein